MAQLRKLLPTEGALLADHLTRLAPEDRRLRFGGMLLRDEGVRRYVASIDWARSWHVGCFDRGLIRAVVQLSVPDEKDFASAAALPWRRPGAAEFAVSVEKSWQRKGLATRLMAHAVCVARNRNVRDLYMLCLPENEPMRRLARRVGIRLVFDSGEITGHVDLPAPDQLTVMAEFWSETAAAIDRWADLVVPQAAE